MTASIQPLEPVQAVSTSRSAWLRSVLPAAIAALCIRMVVVCLHYRNLPDASQNYEQFGWEIGWVARSLASGHGFGSPFPSTSTPTAMVSPLYTYLLGGVFRLFGIYSLTSAFVILSINSLFSALTCIPVYFSADYSLGFRGARIASWVWALYPLAIYFSAGRVWEYSLTILSSLPASASSSEYILPRNGFTGLASACCMESRPTPIPPSYPRCRSF